MQLIYTSTTSKKKKRKPNAKQRELQASWEALLKKHASKTPVRNVKPGKSPVVSGIVRRETEYIPSLNTNTGTATKAAPKVYTGDKVLGIAVMHKSNAVPIFKEEDAIDIARMRR